MLGPQRGLPYARPSCVVVLKIATTITVNTIMTTLTSGMYTELSAYKQAAGSQCNQPCMPSNRLHHLWGECCHQALCSGCHGRAW